jgi:TonB family protein
MANNNSDLKPEFQNNGLKDNVTTTPPAATKDTNNSKDSKNTKGVVIGSNSSKIAQNEKEVKDLKYIFTTDKQVADLYSKNLIKDTQIAPSSVMISNPLERQEKGVEWIPPKVTNIAGKKGTVTYLLLVNPVGKVETRFLQSSGDKELDNIVREAVEKYSFKPIEDPQSGKYRLVKAEYKFS